VDHSCNFCSVASLPVWVIENGLADVSSQWPQQRPKGEAAKQRTSEQPIFTLSASRGLAWRYGEHETGRLPIDGANHVRCGVASPWPRSLKYFWGNFSYKCFLKKILNLIIPWSLLQGYLIYPLPRRERVSLPAIASLLVQARPASRGFNRGGRGWGGNRKASSILIPCSLLQGDSLWRH